MVKLEWGVKRTCQNCGSRFYDLQRSPATCPKCGSVFEALAVAKRGRRAAVDAAKVAPFSEDGDLLDQELGLEVDIDENIDDDVIEDTSDFGEDLDEMSDVMEVEKDDE